MLVHHWFMDNWPAWKLEMKSTAEIEADHAAKQAMIDDARPGGNWGLGLGVGAAAGVGFYFISVFALPFMYEAVGVIF